MRFVGGGWIRCKRSQGRNDASVGEIIRKALSSQADVLLAAMIGEYTLESFRRTLEGMEEPAMSSA